VEFTAKNKGQVEIKILQAKDLGKLEVYLNNLLPATKQRFSPHGFDLYELKKIFCNSNDFLGFVAEEKSTGKIVAYSVFKKGILEHDSFRLESYGLQLKQETDCTFAPSVADEWQSQGIGDVLFIFVIKYLKSIGFKRLILWGGVQSSNEKALNFYNKNGFIQLGSFEYHGWNYDMIKEIS